MLINQCVVANVKNEYTTLKWHVKVLIMKSVINDLKALYTWMSWSYFKQNLACAIQSCHKLNSTTYECSSTNIYKSIKAVWNFKKFLTNFYTWKERFEKFFVRLITINWLVGMLYTIFSLLPSFLHILLVLWKMLIRLAEVTKEGMRLLHTFKQILCKSRCA